MVRILIIAVCVCSLAAAADYQRDIRPVLAKKCFACHGPDEHSRQMKLRLDTRAGATGEDGGYKGIVPGNSSKSRVMARIVDKQRPMPPAGPGLTAEEVSLVREWIDGGAAYSAHWSFQKPAHAPGGSIDKFVEAGLKQDGLTMSPEAEPAVLARRVALDLTGLPPDAAALKDYLADPSRAGYERLVDKLLASPAYGERWARVWLDLARYADTQGYEKDNKRTIWPYRDWVIRAFNENMPFDRFTIEQLAGDLLPNPTEAQLIATGFHRNTMTNTEGGTDDEEFRDAAVKDRVAVTGQVWMGLTTGCAQCHTHKYDPISHEEFYRLYAYFNQTADKDQPNDAPVLKLANDVSTLVLRDLPAEERRTTRIHQRGNFLDPGKEVQPGVPSAFHGMPAGTPANRLGLARWLVNKENPLTARVMVNRLWARLFGAGIVETEEDFGTQGASPSHPELLDFLAVEFMQSWDVKAILKTMAMSSTYRQASSASKELLEKDPRNRLLARGPRVRLDAEMVRDQALAVSGLLSKKMYGPPVMPWQPEGIWLVVYSGDKWETSPGEDRYRRGLYTFLRRSSPYPTMIAYDAPTGEVCTIRRIRTNTPLQALASLNDPVAMEAAQRLGRWAIEDIKGNDRARAEAMFRRVLVRDPAKEETERILALYKESAKELKPSSASQGKLLHYDQTLYTEDREVVLVADARSEAPPQWSYIANETGDAPGAGWFKPGFDAGSWQRGKGQFAWYKKPPDDAKTGTEWHTSNIWLRIEFDVPEGQLEDLQLQLRTAGMFESYLNGVPAAQSPIDRGSYYEYAVSPEAAATLKPGRNVLAIHATHIREKDSGQVIDASLRALRPLSYDKRSVNAKRAAWVVVANTLLNLDETLSRR